MAYDRQFIRVTFGFTVKVSDEIADTTISYSSAAGWTGAAAALTELSGTTGIGGDAIDGLTTLLGNANLFWANYSEARTVKYAAIGTNGEYLAPPFIFEDSTPSIGGSTTTLPQSTVVLSLRSGFTLGKGNYGRMYLPHTRLGLVSGTAKSNEATTDLVVADAKTFVNDLTTLINTDTTATLFPVIMSQTGITSRGVTQLGIGDVTDTQRRRRNRLPEAYSLLAL